MLQSPDFVDRAKMEGYQIITIPDNLKGRVSGEQDLSGNPIRELGEFYKEYEESFEFDFVELNDLTYEERKVFDLTPTILILIGGISNNVKDIKISNSMRTELGFAETTGIWEHLNGWIIIKREQLLSIENYAGTLIHEVIHAKSGASDVTRDFEHALTRIIGLLCSKLIQDNAKKPSIISRAKQLITKDKWT